MTDFNVNTSKENLRQRMAQRTSVVLQRIELLKKNTRTPLANSNRLHFPRKQRAGFTMTETLLVIIVVISVLASLLALFFGVQNHLRNAALQSQMIRAVGIIERAHSYSGTYGAGSLVGFLNGEGFSANQVYNDGTNWVFKTPYDTLITITGGGDSGAAARHFTMVVNGLPPAACKLAALAFRDSGSGLDTVTINGADFTPTLSAPLDEGFVDTECNRNTGTDGGNDVTLTF